ncbi:MAG: glutamine--fructose-6-phosphate transaminase (isomerizing) [Candidatus Methanofastidiosa archaeon]|nr:glutamine--fructose-6-phosphate transaminase (isomerizing) [Candidatus Methanofastidiosa archaeon]
MCGIVGIITNDKISIKNDLLKSLKRLEYRGYDSVGYANIEGNVEKNVGEISKFMDEIQDSTTSCAISHTRWATHGGVTKINSHPHWDCKKNIFTVHNGIIENYQELKKELVSKGHIFITETDSEIISHFLEEELKTKSMLEAIKAFVKKIEGTYAILVIEKSKNRIYAIKKDSPLVLGLGKDLFYLASDIYAFSDRTNKAIFFEDGEIAIVNPKDYVFYDSSGKEIKKGIYEFSWSITQEESVQEYPHYMIKEIHEQPIASQRLINSLDGEQHAKIKKIADLVKNSKRVVFTAAGSSYYASLLGVYFLNRVEINAHTLIASEFQNFMLVDKDTLFIAISQSGETMDVVTATKWAKERGAKIVSIVNVPHSTIQRMSDISLEIHAGPEICVAATKTFTNQVVSLLYLAYLLGFSVNMKTIPDKIDYVIKQNEGIIKKMADELYQKKDIYIIGRGLSYPPSREMALKLKEISYIHAEGMMGGELKHGTIALIEPGTPVIALIPGKDFDMYSNAKEVEARGARVITIANMMDSDFKMDITINDGKFSILAVIIGQLLTYYIARKKELPIDKPRNLAKSVTVK